MVATTEGTLKWLTLFADFEALKLDRKVAWAQVKMVKSVYNAKLAWLESQLSPWDGESTVSAAFSEWWRKTPYSAGGVDIIFSFDNEGRGTSSVRTRTLSGNQRVEVNLCVPLPETSDTAPKEARDALAKALSMVVERFQIAPPPALPLTKKELGQMQTKH